MSIKTKFGTTDLKTEYAFLQHIESELNKGAIDKEALAFGLLGRVIDYSKWLNETLLTESMLQKGGIFKDSVRFNTEDPTIKAMYMINDIVMIEFCMIYNSKEIKIVGFNIHSGKEKLIQTLADLARLTSDSPIPLR